MSLLLAIVRLLFCLGGAKTVIAAVSCYNVKNTQLSSAYTPCNSASGSVSMCCGGTRGDVCLSNGLCQYRLTSNSEPSYWREGCTDKSWTSAYCLKNVCAGSSDIDGEGDSEMTPCDGTSTSVKWCCGKGNKGCCGTGKEVILAAMPGVGSVKSSSSAVAVAVSVPTSTAAESAVVNDHTSSTTMAHPQPTSIAVQNQNQDGTFSQPATSVQDERSDSPAPTVSSLVPVTPIPGQSQSLLASPVPPSNMNLPLPFQQGASFQPSTSMTVTGTATNGKDAVLQTSLSSAASSPTKSTTTSTPGTSPNTNASIDPSLTSAAKAGIVVGLAILLLTAGSIVLYMCVVRKSGTWRSRHDVVEIVEYQPAVERERAGCNEEAAGRREVSTRMPMMPSWARPGASKSEAGPRFGVVEPAVEVDCGVGLKV